MKRMLLLLVSITILQGCGEGVIPNSCILGSDVIHTIEAGSGYFQFNEELRAYTISYYVPGTIDSQLTGVICESLLPTNLPQEGRVSFSGEFIDDNDRFDPPTQTGGEEFFYLNLLSIEADPFEHDTH